MSEWRKIYSGTFDIFRRYWRAYGGAKAVLKSFYAHLALILTGLTFPLWSKTGWWEIPISVMPNLLGFSLAGYAIMLSFGNEGFQRLLSKSRLDETNAFVEMSASFTHFLLIQFVALLSAILAKSLYSAMPTTPPSSDLGVVQGIVGGIGMFIFVYSLTCGIAATMRIFRLTEVFGAIATRLSSGNTTSGRSDGQSE